MPKCKYCHGNITKFDKERCPLCGALKPLEGNFEETSDITQIIDTLPREEQNKIYKPHSHKTNSFLLMFLGIFGLDSFYLGFYKYGFIRIIINSVFGGGLFCLFYFLNIFKTYSLILSIVVSVGILFVIYFILGLITLFKTPKKDSNGVFLK